MSTEIDLAHGVLMHPEFRRNPLWRIVAVQRQPPLDLRYIPLEQHSPTTAGYAPSRRRS
jgi:hypothetical protein